MIGMADAYRHFGNQDYWRAYEAIHYFVSTKGINHRTGELWPLLTCEG